MVEASLFQDTVQCTRGDVIIAIPGYRYQPGLVRMAILMVTPASSLEIPSVIP